MRLMVVSPSAARAAMTRETLARRSVAITGAPRRAVLPWTVAQWPSMVISAPMRASSGTCMKRFSKMVSHSAESPFAWVSRVMNWACMSVGKSGKGAVVMSMAFSGVAGSRAMRSVPCSAFSSMVAPIWRRASSTTGSVSARVSCRVTSPPVMATAAQKVPVSMRSGITR